ncbi:hypothetical protein HJC23_004050 [Cyclotella cryptica]|uniref:SKP1 component dimerisation domain-containing protein n=1 Tax=Cyclotella cryptica TaxID=29204 RepID=A0ABD3QUM6_9STRA|eukprot:CCRYP_002041-RA/>CCRYP_002041-RA protein AED:0.01 eAED:0.01 QI:2970/1/1/1/1/1/2/1104/205
MKTIKLLGNNCEEVVIPLAATTISEVLLSEIECHEENLAADDYDDNACVASLSLTRNKEITSAALRKVADFLTHYATCGEMTPFEPPFTSANLKDIVKEKWYRDFITVGVDRKLLLDLIAAANFLSIQPLLKLAALAISLEINGNTPNEIRHIFGISNDLSNPEQKERVRAENEWAYQARRQYDEEIISVTRNNSTHKNAQSGNS